MEKYLSVMSRKTKLKCAGVIGLAFVGSLLASLWPVQLGELYNGISDGAIGTLARGAAAIALFGLIYLAAEWIAIVRRVLLDCIVASHEAEVRSFCIEKLLKMPVAYYSGCLSGEKTAQLNQGVAGFSQLIKILCNDVFATVLTAVCTLAQVLFHAPVMMAGIMLLYLVLTVVISAFQIRSQNGIREKIVHQKTALDGQICQSISNLELIRSMDAEEYEKHRLEPGVLDISHTEKKHHKYMGLFDCLKQLCKIVFQVTLLGVSVVLIGAGRMDGGSVITVCLLFQQLIKPIDEVYRFMDETASSLVKAKALLEVTASPSDEVFSRVSSGQPLTDGSVHLEQVLVTNPEKDKPLALYQDLTIPGGKKVALQGVSGCGKTTMVRCLNRYYPYTRGKVTLFGRDLESYSQKELTSLLYYVPQSTFFFAGTVRDNLVYGLDADFTDGQLLDALRQACLIGDYEGVLCREPERALAYTISEGAANLSGGQRQRLSLARAFLRRPKLYIFDESTANLDEQTASAVLTHLERHAAADGAGILYISHDQNVVDRCDQVIVLANSIASRSPGPDQAAPGCACTLPS